ncbi:MAG: hypothetical protein LBJ10_01415, partial [Clostridiales bacterium]|nr:hypothetical protein [Clostridiales bacterium]
EKIFGQYLGGETPITMTFMTNNRKNFRAKSEQWPQRAAIIVFQWFSIVRQIGKVLLYLIHFIGLWAQPTLVYMI